MNRYLIILPLFIFMAISAVAQQGKWRIILNSGEELQRVDMRDLQMDSMVISNGRLELTMAYDAIAEIRLGHSYLMIPGMLIGGVGIGYLTLSAASSDDPYTGTVPILGAYVGGLFGGLMGAIAGSELTPDDVYDLRGMDRAAKRTATEYILAHP